MLKGLILGLIIGATAGYLVGTRQLDVQNKVETVADQELQDKVKKSVKQTAEDAKRLGKKVLDDTKEKIHKATEPKE